MTLLATIVSIGLTRSPSAGEKEPPRTDVLRTLVKQLIDYQVELTEEDVRWEEEKTHLETTHALLEKERDALDRELAASQQAAETTETEQNEIAVRNGQATETLDRIGTALTRAGRELLNTCDALPEPAREPLKNSARHLRSALDRPVKTGGALDRLRHFTALATEMDRALESVHTGKETLEIPGVGRMEVDVIYLGGAIGYYVSFDNLHAGILQRGDDGWRAHPRPTRFAEAVREARAVARKETPAAIVELPVRPEGGGA